MNIAVIYIFPNIAHNTYWPMARRFTDKYLEHPPGISDHNLYVVINGNGRITPSQVRLFAPLVPQFLYHDNSGMDIGGYVMAARTLTCDLIVCLGAPVRPCHAGWLDMIVHAVDNNGPGLFGFWGSHVPSTHLSTTAFAITPQLLDAYPFPITNETRYRFEFGPQSITAFTMKQGFPVRQVTARGAFPPDQFHVVSREDSLLLNQHDKHFGYKD